MYRKITTYILIICSTIVSAQVVNDTLNNTLKLTTIAHINQGESYITFPIDIGNIKPLWFEANISPNFYIRTSKKSRLVGVLTPQIILRMYQEESFPVRTPSYMPQITAYYRLNKYPNINSINIWGRIAHHSNGQEDDFYLENGEINTKSGNFATNYFDIGLLKTNLNKQFNAVQFFSTSIEIHPEKLNNKELIGIYSLYRWNMIFSIFKLPLRPCIKHKKASFSVKAKSNWMLGNYNNLHWYSIDRLNLSLTFFYHPHFLQDIGLFTSFYHGMDYYNIYFNHQITVLRFGIMTEKLNF